MNLLSQIVKLASLASLAACAIRPRSTQQDYLSELAERLETVLYPTPTPPVVTLPPEAYPSPWAYPTPLP